MHRSVPARLVALLVALLVTLAAPGLAVAHGIVHDHLAREHAPPHHAGAHDAAPGAPAQAGHEDAGPSAPVLGPADHDHEHGHPTLDAAPGTRDLARLDLGAGPFATREPPAVLAALVVVRSPALTDRALLARPDPGSGPPPRLRAPPVR